MLDIEVYFERYCKEHDLEIALSWEMPEGYETAFGSFDPTRRTLFLNKSLLRTAPEEEALFYLYHELRHALQYLRPELFDQQVQTSRFYVVLYNGVCYKLVDNTWKMYVLEIRNISKPPIYRCHMNWMQTSMPIRRSGRSLAIRRHCGSWLLRGRQLTHSPQRNSSGCSV